MHGTHGRTAAGTAHQRSQPSSSQCPAAARHLMIQHCSLYFALLVGSAWDASAAASSRAAACPPLSCQGTNASGAYSTALGFGSAATGDHATALGDTCIASGHSSSALGHHTSAGMYSTAAGYKTVADKTGTAFGYFTTATGEYSTVMGNYIGTTEKESLAVSGNVHARNIHLVAEDRLATNVTAAPRDRGQSMLAELRRLELVEYSPSAHVCAHRYGLSARDCAAATGLRQVGLLASRLQAAMPDTVTTTQTSLHLIDAASMHTPTPTRGQQQEREEPRVLESVAGVRSLDVAALLTRLVGSAQALDEQHAQAVARQQAALAAQGRQIEELRSIVRQQGQAIASLLEGRSPNV
jgi:hypothetical protein